MQSSGPAALMQACVQRTSPQVGRLRDVHFHDMRENRADHGGCTSRCLTRRGRRRCLVMWAGVGCATAIALCTLSLPSTAIAQRASVDGPIVRYRLDEVMRLGGDDDTLLVSHVTDLAVDASYIFAALPGEAAVLVFTREGRFVRRIGRSGGGPGEFSMPMRLGWRGDSLWVGEGGRPRVQFFTRDGALLRGETPRRPGYFIPLADSFWLAELPEAMSPSGVGAPRPIVMAQGSTAGRLDSVAWMVPRGRSIRAVGSSSRAAFLSPIAGNAWAAIAPDGSALFIVETDTSRTHRLRVRKLSARGSVLWDTSVEYEPIRSTSQWYEAEIRSRTRAAGEIGLSEETIRRAIPRPAYLPPITAAIATAAGGLWLRRVVPEGSPTLFIALDTLGRLHAHIEGPPGLRLLRIEKDRAFGLLRTDMGSDVIVVYRVR